MAVGGMLFGSVGLLTIAGLFTGSGYAQTAGTQKPNILFIMGDDIGWMQPSCYHRGLMVGETPNIDRIGEGRRDLHGLLRRAELHFRSQCLHHRHAPAAHGHDPAAVARQPVVPAARHAVRSPSSCTISATTPASSARTIWATIPMPCRRPTASRSSGATSIIWTPCSG